MKYNIIIPFDSLKAQYHAIEHFTREFGGCTVEAVTGFWRASALPPGVPVPVQLPGEPEHVYAEREPNVLIWSFGPNGWEAGLKVLASTVRELANQDAVMFWTEPGEADFVYRPAGGQIAPTSSALN